MISRSTLLVLLLIFACPDVAAQEWRSAAEWPSENGRWLCWEYSDKNQQDRAISKAQSLEYFTKNLSDFDSEIAWRKANEKLQDWSLIQTKIKPVGIFAGQLVIDIFYYLMNDADKEKPFGQMVVIGSKKPIQASRLDT